MEYIGYGFILIGALFTFLGGLGVLRMPDTMNRIQAGTKATTLGLMSVMVGLAFLFPSWTLKLIVIIVFITISNPIGSSVLARAVYLGQKEQLILKQDDLAKEGELHA